MVKSGPLKDAQKAPIRYMIKAPAPDPSDYGRPLAVEECFTLLMKRRRLC
jgi:hypothetical protein